MVRELSKRTAQPLSPPPANTNLRKTQTQTLQKHKKLAQDNNPKPKLTFLSLTISPQMLRMVLPAANDGDHTKPTQSENNPTKKRKLENQTTI